MHIGTSPSILIAAAFALATLTPQPVCAAAMPQPSFHTKGTPTGKPTGALKPGEYWWNPRVSPQGPLVLLVSLPMPNMQRLTWSGIAMHSGNLPGYPASHGCIRMPYDFSTLLFRITGSGGTVVIGNDTKAQPHFTANPGVMLAPKDFTPEMLESLANDEYQWNPERSTKGPITMLASAADRTLYVYRNGEPIGRAAIEVRGRLGGHVFTLLEGVTGAASPWAPGRPARKWMSVQSDAASRSADVGALAKRVRISQEFAGKLYDTLTPGATIIVTDAPAVRKASRDFTILAD